VCDERPLQDAVLALMHLNAHEDAFGWRAWKSFPWEATDRFHERGLIDDPRTRAKSVALTDEGARLAGQLFAELFGVEDAGSDWVEVDHGPRSQRVRQATSHTGCLPVLRSDIGRVAQRRAWAMHPRPLARIRGSSSLGLPAALGRARAISILCSIDVYGDLRRGVTGRPHQGRCG
jgi:hypothetical protein